MNIYYTSVKGRRISNEDRHNVILNLNNLNDKVSPINLLSIYDGHGGSRVSEFLEKNLPLYYCLPEVEIPFSKEYHYKIFDILQKRILENKYGYTMGSTCLLNIIYKYKNEYHMNIVNLGDSRLVIIYKNGLNKQITEDHKPDNMNEINRIQNMGGEIYNDTEGTCRIGDLSVSRAFGDGDNAPYISQKPDVYYKKITEQTAFVVMGCDGLWDVINNDELFLLLEKYKNNSDKNLASCLANEALIRGSTDNISVIVIEFN